MNVKYFTLIIAALILGAAGKVIKRYLPCSEKRLTALDNSLFISFSDSEQGETHIMKRHLHHDGNTPHCPDRMIVKRYSNGEYIGSCEVYPMQASLEDYPMRVSYGPTYDGVWWCDHNMLVNRYVDSNFVGICIVV